GDQKGADWKQLLEIAAIADPADAWRRDLRQALIQGDRQALEQLASSADTSRLPPSTLNLLGTALFNAGAKEQAMAFLQRAQVQYPEDWWINTTLAGYCAEARPPRYDEALRYYAAARAVRPRDTYSLLATGSTLNAKKAYPEAIATFSRLSELKPESQE